MSVRIIDCIQGEPAWHAARAGIPTASEFQTLLAKGRGGGESVGRRKYLLTKAGEVLTGECAPEGYTNAHMDRGKAMEEEARDWYAFQSDHDPVRVGFVRNDLLRAGVSPDSLIGTAGGLEIKTKLPHLQLELLLSGELPSEHKAQCQGLLLVAEREWIDFVSYWPKLPPFCIRVTRDEPYIAALKIAIADFNQELDALVAKFQNHRAAA